MCAQIRLARQIMRAPERTTTEDAAAASSRSRGESAMSSTLMSDSSAGSESADVDSDNRALELWYQYQVTDSISVKPAVFWTNNYASDADDTFGALVQTTFKF